MSLDKVKAAVANAPLCLSVMGMQVLREEGVPEETLEKIEPILKQDIPRDRLVLFLAQLITPDELTKFGPIIEAASSPTYITVPASVYYEACNEAGKGNTIEGTAGHLARKHVNSGIRLEFPGTTKTILMRKPNAKAKMSLSIPDHVLPLFASAAKTTIPVAS